jgi:hypothetical protein
MFLRVRTLRFLGALLFAAAIAAWWIGLDPFPLTWWNIRALFPPHLVLGIVGLGLILFPSGVVQIVTAPFGKIGEGVLKAFREANPVTPSQAQPPQEDTAQLADWVTKEYKRRDKRFALAVAAGIVSVVVVVPLFVYRYGRITRYGEAGQALSYVVQEHPLSFGASDVYRRVLSQIETSITAFGEKQTASRTMFDVLSFLYATDVTSDTLFASRLRQVYVERVEPGSLRKTDFLGDSIFVSRCNRNIEPAFACQSYLTLLAGIAASQGGNSKFLRPYIRSRQLATAAKELRGSVAATPSANYLLALSLQAMIDQHGAYAISIQNLQKWRNDSVRVRYIDEPEPQTEVTLARRAAEELDVARRSTTSNINQARYLNNSVDLRLALLVRALVEKRDMPTPDSPDRSFLEKSIGGAHGKMPSQEALGRTFMQLDAMLDSALALARVGEIFFTRGQLYSVAGELVERSMLPASALGNRNDLEFKTLRNLRMARTMGVPAELFTKDRAGILHLEWIWRHPNVQQFLVGDAVQHTTGR